MQNQTYYARFERETKIEILHVCNFIKSFQRVDNWAMLLFPAFFGLFKAFYWTYFAPLV